MSQRMAAALLIAVSAAACADQPTGVELAPSGETTSGHVTERRVERAAQRASLLTEIPIMAEQDGEMVPAFLSLTSFSAEESDGDVQLFADGVVSFINEEGQYLAEVFEDVPITLSRTAPTPSGINAALLPSSGETLQQRGPSETGVCDILFLTLGPLNLDLLGLTVDLSNIELDLDAVPGAGRLLGNLLCAVTSLLDGVGFLLQILQILDQINAILDAINNLFSAIPVFGSVASGDLTGGATGLALALGTGQVADDEFKGTLTVTSIDWDEAGETFLVDGVLNGKARVAGKMTQLRNVLIEDVPATLDDESAAASPTSGDLGIMQQRSPNEDNVCDVLFLNLAPTFLDLLGLTVDLAEVELDVDAVPGGGRLLGNLLCAVTGLLDGVGTGGLLQGLLQGLLDAIGQLLGGLSP